LPGPFFSFQKNPAVYSVLCIPAQILVFNTADVTGKFFFWIIHKRYVVAWVLIRVLFILLRSYISITRCYVSEGYTKEGFHGKVS
jgi:hypothetical protein